MTPAKERGKTRRHLERYREIVGVLLKYGFGRLLSKSHLRHTASPERKEFARKGAQESQRYSPWVRIRMALEELGPTFIKLGQIMSNRPDLLPIELVRELEKLQKAVQPFPGATAKQIVEKELNKPIDELFSSFSESPEASASIAQAHRARLISGEEVIVKVQRPNIETIIKTDIEILLSLAGFFQKLILKSDALDTVGIIHEFGRSLNREIDFYNEALNLERFKANFRGNTNILVPSLYKEYSSRRVITMEYIQGTHVSDLTGLDLRRIDSKDIAKKGADLVLEQIFEHGFFHADPHPGNVLILDDGRICFLDFGMMGMLLPKHRTHLSNIIIGVVNQDSEKITKALIDFSRNKNVEHPEELEYDLFELSESYAHLPLKEINMGELIPKMLDIVLDYDLRLPAGIFMLSKALITIEGVGRRLDPDFDMIEQIKPFARKLIRNRFSYDRLKKDAFISLTEMEGLLRNLPADTREIIQVLKSGKLKLEAETRSLQPLLRKSDKGVNRLAMSLLAGSLILGSSLLLGLKVPPLWHGLSLLGLAGLLSAGVTGVWLLIGILRNNRL